MLLSDILMRVAECGGVWQPIASRIECGWYFPFRMESHFMLEGLKSGIEHRMFGIPIIVRADVTPGAWKIIDRHNKEITSGTIV